MKRVYRSLIEQDASVGFRKEVDFSKKKKKKKNTDLFLQAEMMKFLSHPNIGISFFFFFSPLVCFLLIIRGNPTLVSEMRKEKEMRKKK